MSEQPGALTEVMLAGAGSVLRCRRAILKVSSGPDAGLSVVSVADRLSIGTQESNDLSLSDRSVSRFHAELSRTPDGFRLKDLGSTNGTFVGNLRVIEALLEADATLRLGQTTVRLSVAREREDVSLHPESRFGRLVGHSVAMRVLFSQLARVAPTSATALVQGESGTGKEDVARALHEGGPRSGGPFVVVDCAAIPPDLVESELFGHEKGAFTGAAHERRGAFESAHGGTLFLDEIGELPLAIQPRLLRALEARQVKRVGADQYRPVDVRIVAATHRDLRQAVNRGQFREDLYFRLAVATLRIPPLREHLEDLPLLLEELWGRASKDLGVERPFPAPGPETLAELGRLPWEGNVRELRNFVERSLAISGDLDPVQLETGAADSGRASPALAADSSFTEAKAVWNDQFERTFLAERLARAGGNVSRLARDARMDRAHAIKLLHKHG
ncbi:MAG: sigma 54-dependent Fis family transcriptional regulator, partial [Deltaproteobacteria bacterium]|nr:sigma 54-dependent Fis family transcriptional regulator [Deltaproteobacteria bacterium]